MAEPEYNYPSNSYTSREPKKKEEEKHLEPVVTHETTVKKKSAIQKFSDVFIAQDIHSVMEYVLKDLLVPGLKRILLSGLEMWLTGKKTNRTGTTSSSNSGVTTVSYRNYYDEPRRRDTTLRDTDYPDFDRIIFNDRGDAERVRDQLIDILRAYRVVRVSELYELARQPAPYTANRYGWTNLDNANARVVTAGNGYTIVLPRAFPLD